MPTIYAGTSGWAYPSWKPRFYPAKLASAKFLGYYATRLNTVEVNYTFRARASERLLAGWIQATPATFRFAIKAHQRITHILRLRSAAAATRDFLSSLEPLRQAERLGPVLFQLPPFLKCDLTLLEDFLGSLPQTTRAAIEFRHTSWFVDPVYERLGRANVALCQAESEKLETPDVRTADFGYFRLRKEQYSASARQELKRTISDTGGSGDVFVYFKHEDTPDGALYAEALLQNTVDD
jgi:uncharacterized protein YecE (DUF72 family)